MNILFASDVSFNYFDGKYPGDEAAKLAMSQVKPYFESADFSVFNLEFTFGTREENTPIIKSGPNQISAPEFIKYVEEMSPSVACLANNHTGDYGEAPIYRTIEMLEDMGITPIGAGATIGDAYKPALFEKDGVKIAIIGVCENEFGIATETKPGSAGYSLGRVTKAIKKAIKKGYQPIIFFHGGNEHYAFPSPKKRELYRHFVDLGAVAVMAMHTHCPQGYEIYEGAPIVYSMGNFYFPAPDYPTGPRLPIWSYGYMTSVDFSDGGATLSIIPYKQSFEKIEILSGEELEHFTEYMEVISRPISDEQFINDYFEAWCCARDFLKNVEYSEETIASPKLAASTKNLFSCEAHNEVVSTQARLVFEGRLEEAKQRIPALVTLQQMEIPDELR